MAMGIVSDREFDSALIDTGASKPPVNKSELDSHPIKGEVIDLPNKGRGNNPAVPDGLRKLIGTESETNGRQSAIELAESFGISPSAVSAYGVGAHSTSTYNDRPNESSIKGAKLRVSKRARAKLMTALACMTKDKLEVTTAKDLATIAKEMSVVMRNMEPDSKLPTVNDSGPKFVFYSPQFKKESNYDVVVAKE